MSTSTSSQSFRLEAAKVIFGPTQCRSWLFDADSSSDTLDEYREFNYYESVSNVLVEKKGYAWMNVGGVGSDPAPAGKDLSIEVAYAADADGATRAAALISALDTEFASSGSPLMFWKISPSSTATVILDNGYPGAITAEAGSGSEKITVAILRVGAGGDLGPTKEGIEVASETTLFEVKSNQKGELVLDRIVQGTNLSLDAGFLDVSQANKETIIGLGVGDTLVSGSNTIVGLGESKLFQNASDIGGRLILHPIRLDLSDRSSDVVIWNSLAQLSSINFDGTDTQTISASFGANLDSSIDESVNLGVFGSEWVSNDLLR
jgi:hypothetical protein